jgi:hypothetical protein
MIARVVVTEGKKERERFGQVNFLSLSSQFAPATMESFTPSQYGGEDHFAHLEGASGYSFNDVGDDTSSLHSHSTAQSHLPFARFHPNRRRRRSTSTVYRTRRRRS